MPRLSIWLVHIQIRRKYIRKEWGKKNHLQEMKKKTGNARKCRKSSVFYVLTEALRKRTAKPRGRECSGERRKLFCLGAFFCFFFLPKGVKTNTIKQVAGVTVLTFFLKAREREGRRGGDRRSVYGEFVALTN